MADPQPYVIGYSFQGFQNNSPATPLPATRLDNELQGAAAAIGELIGALKSVRRSDGALVNGIVTFDSLALGLQITFDPTNGELVAEAVAGAQASAASAASHDTTAAASATAADAARVLAEAAAASVNLSGYLPKNGNLAGLGSLSTARDNLGLGTSAVLDVGVVAGNVVQLDGNAKLPAVDGSQLTNIDVLPVGTSILVNGTTAPAGTVKENGALLSRTLYPRLWAFAQASGMLVSEATWAANFQGSFSTGDLATTFRVPDSRGEFIRGFDDSRGVDTGRAAGSFQLDALKNHTHTFRPGLPSGISVAGGANVFNANNEAVENTSGPSTGAATETRPRNIPKLVCIKY